ncbi:uncharacterized protein [Nicotiana tomentosiformis]|uniref:uncharacterized protein n=1 Tax=Nicotiana tomentosiformis TaxID=4098 RepID=UPI00051B15F4|nr:ganglioside-induced differentiation-associated protein 2-like [Nicotiana tomentosiformis]
MNSPTCLMNISQPEQEKLIDKLQIFKIQGKDKRGCTILRIIGKLFPARIISVEAVNKYLLEKIYPNLEQRQFSIVYAHTGVNRSENFPGIAALRSICDAMPANVKDHLKAVYFLHPSLQSRLFLALFGRLLFTGGIYWKLNYVTRLEFLWEHVKRKEIEMPEFVYEFEEELDDYRPMTDYGMEGDHPRVYIDSTVESAVSMYSMRCIA